MESDLLKRENEFYKENEKLELKAKELVTRVNDVMKMQQNLIKESLKTKTEIVNAKMCNFKSNDRNHPKYLERIGDCIENDENASIRNSAVGQRQVSNFYRDTIKCLQADNVILQNENRKRNEEVKKLQKENQSLLDEKEKWFLQYNSAKDTIGKMMSQITILNSKCQQRDNEAASLKKDLEQIKKELRKSNLNAANFEVRLNRTCEENEKLKVSLKTAKDEEKELRDSHKKQINGLTDTVKRIEKHKRELIDGFKIQSQLIDNLKKQKMYLEVHKLAGMAESEYMKLLDSNLVS